MFSYKCCFAYVVPLFRQDVLFVIREKRHPVFTREVRHSEFGRVINAITAIT